MYSDEPGFDVEVAKYHWPGLNTESLVFDIGAFEGIWAQEIARKYHPRQFYLFEPQHGTHIQRLHNHLLGYDYILFDFALGDRDGEFAMVEYGTDGASFLSGADTRQQVGSGTMVDAAAFLTRRAAATSNIDLTSMNIEGYEFILLPYLHTHGLLPRFERLMVQFHTFVENSQAQYEYICNILGETHTMLWECYPTWVAWERKAA